MFLRGRPVVLYGPSDQDGLDPAKVAPPPQSKLKLEWVYGYRGKDCRSNLYLLPTGEIVYFVAAVVVLMNVEEQCQRHYTGHTDDVKCLAIHPNKLIVASGQCAGHDRVDARPHVRVWNSVSLATLAVLGGGQLQRGVAGLAFSRADGALLAALDEAPDHTIAVWDWQRPDKHCLAETKCSVDTVVAVEFHPLDRNQIVTCGKNHIAFWTLDQTNMLYKRMGVFEGRDKPKYVTCLAFNPNGDVLSGDSNGNIIVWGRGTNTIAKLVRGVHEGPVFSLCCLKDGGVVSGGGKDGRLVMFDSELNATGIENVIEGHYGGVRVVAEGRGSQLYVGTTRNCILHGDLQLGFSPAVLGHVEELWGLAAMWSLRRRACGGGGRGSQLYVGTTRNCILHGDLQLGFSPAVLGHVEELWGLAAHPSLPQFVTAGWDRLLQLWDGLSHSTVWSKDIEERAQCCAWSRDGGAVAVGCLSGRWLVFDPHSRELLASHHDGAIYQFLNRLQHHLATLFRERAQCCAWSRDGGAVAVGCLSGRWLVFDPHSRELLASHHDGCEPIQTIQYSPNNEMVALGSRDNFIYVYQVQDSGARYSRLGKCLVSTTFLNFFINLTVLSWVFDTKISR
ncbi:Echinoderm microtubule-associated protein-like 1 [Papilio xuthus]|uniref:Echinoderm microtubule-associated protein-like 1 n=1 Tax=Papilio xuthus TaxID=66420 RepID=A0A0N1PIS7_PAPXU|nr:Echinoderm microtubule-associated protein-like 1 [Papilio xuthus]